jgi:hypothetical protein
MLAMAALLLGGCLHERPAGEGFDADTVLACYDWAGPARQWRLPRTLQEISGLAYLDGDRWLAHHDNDATIWLLNLAEHGSFKPLGNADDTPSMAGDFEAITRDGGRVYLLASPGRLYHARLDTTTSALAAPLEPIASGIEGACNFEGLTLDDAGALWLACKYPRHPVPGHVHLYRLPGGGGAQAQRLLVDVAPILDALGLDRLRPSGLTWLPRRGRLLVLAGKERVVLELDRSGAVLAWRTLSRRHHRQAEGIAVADDGRLLVADEADGRTATLALYPPRRVQRECERL